MTKDSTQTIVLPDMPVARGSFGCGRVNNRIYAIGGHVGASHSWNEDNYTNRVDCFDIASNQWLPECAQRPVAAEGFRLVPFENSMYAFGGFIYAPPEQNQANQYTGISTSQVERYDTVNDCWESVSSLPTPRSDNMIGIIDETVYLLSLIHI